MRANCIVIKVLNIPKQREYGTENKAKVILPIKAPNIAVCVVEDRN
jgi:hypothetical protein